MDQKSDHGDPERDALGEEAGEKAGASISNGPNARPRNETVAQTAPGLPNDSGRPVEIDPEEEARIAARIRDL
jgi:hypothetical protein